MRQRVIIWPICIGFAIVALYAIILFVGTVGVLGPRDKPDFPSEPWESIDITYWINAADINRPVERVFTIDDQATIAQLKSRFTITETSGLSIGTDRQLIFRQGDKELWQGSPVFEDTFYLSISDDPWRSYKFALTDTRFYDDLRALCVVNEKIFNPEAETKHIKLRGNLAAEYPPLPNP